MQLEGTRTVVNQSSSDHFPNRRLRADAVISQALGSLPTTLSRYEYPWGVSPQDSDKPGRETRPRVKPNGFVL